VKCGRTTDLHPEQESTTRHRNIESEREVTREAARGVVDPSALIEFSEVRAFSLSGEYVEDAMLVALGRDRLRDAKEEISDCRNHLVWHIQENPGMEKSHDALLALRHMCLAYDLLIRDGD
jgi:hypothetical protein